MVSTNNEPFSLRMFVNIYIYIFFILSNAIQFGTNTNVLTFNQPLNQFDFITFQSITFFILILYNGTYKITKAYKKEINIKIEPNTIFLLILSIFFTLVILQRFHFNPYELFLRGMTEEMYLEKTIQTQEQSQMEGLIFSNFIRPIPWVCLLICLIYQVKGYKYIVIFICALLTVFPTGISRSGAAMYWIPIFILLLKKWITGRRFLLVMFFGLFILFPFLDNFRYYGRGFEFNFSLDYLNSMNFDANQLMMALIKQERITYGNQLLGPLLFFVPRSIWPTKPIGSGAYLAELNNASFNNVSMPFFAEGYINFGFIGVLIFTFILAIVCKKFDILYWKSKNHGGLLQGFYLIFLGTLIFILRGDLMSSFAYFSTLCLCFYLISKYIIFKKYKHIF